MTTIRGILALEVWILLGAFLLVSIAPVFARRPALQGLWRAKTRAGTAAGAPLSPARVQLLFTTFVATLYLAVRVLAGGTDRLDFPESFTLAFGASGATYLGLKGWQVTRTVRPGRAARPPRRRRS